MVVGRLRIMDACFWVGVLEFWRCWGFLSIRCGRFSVGIANGQITSLHVLVTTADVNVLSDEVMYNAP